MNDNWFDLHLSVSEARAMTRPCYYAARSYLRYVRRVIKKRYQAAWCEGNIVHTPAMEDVIPRRERR